MFRAIILFSLTLQCQGWSLIYSDLSEFGGNTRGQHPVEQILCLLFLLVELAGPLRHKILQVVRVLLQHLHHLQGPSSICLIYFIESSIITRELETLNSFFLYNLQWQTGWYCVSMMSILYIKILYEMGQDYLDKK